MKNSNRQKFKFFTIIILISYVILGYNIHEINQKRRNAEKWIYHTDDVIKQSDKILSECFDIVSSTRGFVITNDSSFLEPLFTKQNTIFVNIKLLRQLTLDNPRQLKRIDSLSYYVEKRLDFSFQSVELRSQNGLKQAIAKIATKAGKFYMDRINEIIKMIQQEEITLLNQRKQNTEHLIAKFNWIIVMMILTMAILTILLLLAFRKILIQNEEKEKQAAELIIAKDKAEESNRLKSAFLTNMTHEIRTPMNGILGFTSLLKRPGLNSEKQYKYISMIEKSGERMLNIINDILSISKIETGHVEVSITMTNINQQIEYTYNFFQPEAEKNGIQISFQNSLPNNDAFIKTDVEKVVAVLSHLVKNAIKFTKTGNIKFGYTIKENDLEFFVKDTGVGIRSDQLTIIFDRFRQGSESLSRNYEGAGLGLAISKAYVEMLGGKIWVKSDEGKGSTFYFTIPLMREAGENNVVYERETANQVDHLKILIVEDNESSAMLPKKYIGNYCRDILHVMNGIDAIEACHRNPDIDLILMDIKMPEKDGFETARQIRQFNKDVIIIAQTAFAFENDKAKAIEVGCNEIISKPVNLALMIELLEKYFNKS